MTHTDPQPMVDPTRQTGPTIHLIIRDNGSPEVILATLNQCWRDEELVLLSLADPNSSYLDDVIRLDDPTVLHQVMGDAA